MKWTDVDSSQLRNNDSDKKNNADFSTKQRRKNNLKSSLDTDDLQKIRELNHEVPVFKEKDKKFIIDNENTSLCLKNLQMESNIIPDYQLPFTDRKITNDSAIEVFDLDIKGLSERFDEKRFNLFCKKQGYHIVSFKSDFNSIQNISGQTGRIQIRAKPINNQISSIKDNLNQFGIQITPHIECTSKKSNYLATAHVDWKEDNLPKEERRLHSRNFLSPQHSKMKDMESNGDVFGNSPGVGKWEDKWKNSNINDQKEKNLQEANNKNTKVNMEQSNSVRKSSKLFAPVLNSKNKI